MQLVHLQRAAAAPWTHADRAATPPAVARAQGGSLPLHLAAGNKASEEVVKALLATYPDAAKQKDLVRGRGSCTPLLP